MAKAKLITLELPNEPGAAAGVTTVLSDAGVNIQSIFGWGPDGVVQLVVDNPRKAKKALGDAGIAHSEASAQTAELPNKPGALNSHLAKLAKKGVNVRSIIATTTKAGRKAVVVWTTD